MLDSTGILYKNIVTYVTLANLSLLLLYHV